MTVLENKTTAIRDKYSWAIETIAPNGNVTPYSNGTTNLSVRNAQLLRDGTSNPKFVEQIRKKQNATTPYERTETRYTRTSGSYEIRWVLSGSTHRRCRASGMIVDGNTAYLNTVALASASSAQSKALAKFISRANNELRATQSLVSIGELRETIHAIRHPLESLKSGLSEYLLAAKHAAGKARSRPRKARVAKLQLGKDIDRDLVDRGVLLVRKGRAKRQKATLPVVSHSRAIQDAISGTYLEYANGWNPLIRDIVSYSRTLAEHFAAPGVGHVRINAKAEAEPSMTSTLVLTSLSSGEYDAHHSTKKAVSCRYVGEVIVSHTGSSQDLLRSCGFSLKEFVPAMWELLPMSYVSDYFWNMGNILDAFAFNWANVAWVSRSTRFRSTTKVTGINVRRGIGQPQVSASGNLGSLVVEQLKWTRDKPVSPMPSLAFRLPGSHLFSRLANTTSLLMQANSTSRQISRLLNG